MVTGHVPDVEPYFQRCKLSVAPLRYGAGVKGKIHLSMSYGVPVIGSAVALEGISARQGKECMIADTPAEFCHAITAVYYDEELWDRLSKNGQRLIAEHFSFEAARSGMAKLLTLKQ